MLGLTKLLTLASMAKLGSAVAEEQVPIIANPAVQQSRIQKDVLFPAPELSTANPTPQHQFTGTTSAHQEIDPAIPSYPLLMTSPYPGRDHLTNLSSLPLPSRLLTLALINLEPTTSSYATTLYQDALNWPIVFESLKLLSASHNHTWKSTIFYVVEFRSRLKINIDRDLLFTLDRESHREATASGGLLKYWYGNTTDNAEGRNLATCLWVKKEDAVAGGRGPMHKQARSVIPRMYESINVKGLKLTVGDDVSYWKFEPWVEIA